MLSDNVHQSLFLNCEMYGPWDRGSDPRAGPTWPHIKILLNLRTSSTLLHCIFKPSGWANTDIIISNVFNVWKSSSLSEYIFDINWIHCYYVLEALYPNCEMLDPCVKGSRPGSILPYDENELILRKSLLCEITWKHKSDVHETLHKMQNLWFLSQGIIP